MTSISVDQDASAGGTDEAPDRPARWWASDAFAAGVIALASVVGPVLLFAMTDLGVHASNDSLTYLGAADRLTHGAGWTYPFGDVGAPVTLFPPLYPLLLAIPAALGVDPFDWVRWQNAILLALLAGAVGWVVFRETRGHVLAAILASLLVQLGVPTIHPYARIWSETLFFPLVVVALAATARHVGAGRTRALVLAAATTGTAMITRYAGLALFVTCLAVVVVWPGRPIRARVRSTAIYGLIAAIPSALWVLRNSLTSGTLTGDNRLIHELRGEAVLNGLQRIVRWILPARPPGTFHDVVFAIAVAALAAIVVAIVWFVVRGGSLRRLTPSAIVPVCLAYVVVHFTFIVVANAFSTRAPPFNHRILGPAFAPLVIAVVVLGDAIWRGVGNRVAARVALGVAGASLLALSILSATEAMPTIFGAEAGSQAEYRAFGRTLEPLVPSEARLYSTRPNVAWFLLREPVSNLPRSCIGGRVVPNPAFRDELAELGEELDQEPRAVIVFRRSRECEPFSIPVLKRALRLDRVGSGPPGDVWVLSGPAEPTPAPS
jgi:hypothetical protein